MLTISTRSPQATEMSSFGTSFQLQLLKAFMFPLMLLKTLKLKYLQGFESEQNVHVKILHV